MAKLRLTMACWDYDRTRALLEDHIAPDGIELVGLNLPVEETFFRMMRHREFDVAEMSLSSYVVSLFAAEPAFIAIPVFPSRFFRHSSIFINRNRGIREPRDLAGKRVGLPEYQLTACVWIRGLLSDEYGVPLTSPSYFTGGEEQPGREEKIKVTLPSGVRLEPIPAGKTLSQMLDAGELDAVYAPRIPSTFRHGSGSVRRLLEDYAAVEREYFQRTRIFPIMHTVIIRRDLYRQNPWVAQSLYKAFLRAQRLAYQDLYEAAALKFMLPWLLHHVEETRRVMDEDFWPYGLEPNRRTLETFLRYSFEQGLSARQLQPEELFAPESLESFKI